MATQPVESYIMDLPTSNTKPISHATSMMMMINYFPTVVTTDVSPIQSINHLLSLFFSLSENRIYLLLKKDYCFFLSYQTTYKLFLYIKRRPHNNLILQEKYVHSFSVHTVSYQ